MSAKVPFCGFLLVYLITNKEDFQHKPEYIFCLYYQLFTLNSNFKNEHTLADILSIKMFLKIHICLERIIFALSKIHN